LWIRTPSVGLSRSSISGPWRTENPERQIVASTRFDVQQYIHPYEISIIINVPHIRVFARWGQSNHELDMAQQLVQRIRLPDNAHIYYTQVTCSLEDPYPALDVVRRSLVSPGPPQPILDRIFPRTHIRNERPQLMVFCLGSQVSLGLSAPNKLNALTPADLDSVSQFYPI